MILFVRLFLLKLLGVGNINVVINVGSNDIERLKHKLGL